MNSTASHTPAPIDGGMLPATAKDRYNMANSPERAAAAEAKREAARNAS
jgi:hypothetical protein